MVTGDVLVDTDTDDDDGAADAGANERSAGDEADGDELSAGGETSDIEPGDPDGEIGDVSGSGVSGADDDRYTAVGGVVRPVELSDNGLRMWQGLTNFIVDGDWLYFVSGAGFFRANIDFTAASFLYGDGPEPGEDFKVSGDRVFYIKSALSGDGGLYMMDFISGSQILIFSGETAGFDVFGDYIYFTDAADGSLYSLNIGVDIAPVRITIEGALGFDTVICRDDGVILARSINNGHALYLIDIAGELGNRLDDREDVTSGEDEPNGGIGVKRLTNGGVSVLANIGDYIYYEAWDMPGRLYRLDTNRPGAGL